MEVRVVCFTNTGSNKTGLEISYQIELKRSMRV